MVTKNEKLAAAEECLKELATYLSSSEEVNVETFSQEKRERFYALASKYSSFKQDPQLKGFLSSLEDKYQIPAGFRTRVEEYAKRREEVLESAKKADYVDREQQKIKEREDAQAADAIKPMTVEEVQRAVERLSIQLADIEESYKNLKKMDRRILEFAQESPHNFEYTVALLTEMGDERALKQLKKSLPEDKKAALEKLAKHYQALKKSGNSIFVKKNGRFVARKGSVFINGTSVEPVDKEGSKLLNGYYNATYQHKVMVAEFGQGVKAVSKNKDKLNKEQWREAGKKFRGYSRKQLRDWGLPLDVCDQLGLIINSSDGKNANSNRGNGGSGKKPLVRPQAVDGDRGLEDKKKAKPAGALDRGKVDSTRENGGSGEMPEDALVDTKADVNVAKVVKAAADANITQEGAGTAHQSITQNAYEIG